MGFQALFKFVKCLWLCANSLTWVWKLPEIHSVVNTELDNCCSDDVCICVVIASRVAWWVGNNVKPTLLVSRLQYLIVRGIEVGRAQQAHSQWPSGV